MRESGFIDIMEVDDSSDFRAMDCSCKTSCTLGPDTFLPFQKSSTDNPKGFTVTIPNRTKSSLVMKLLA